MEPDPRTVETPAEAPEDERVREPNTAARGRSPLEPLVEAVERAAVLDGPASALAGIYREAFSPPALKAALRGDWLGHAVHPVLSDVVVGTQQRADDDVGQDRMYGVPEPIASQGRLECRG